DGVVGAVSVSSGAPPLGSLTHSLVSLGAWSAAVALVVVAHRGTRAIAVPQGVPEGVPTGEVAKPRPAMRRVAAYVQLTKPRVMSLLLATTAAAMVIAARGIPDLGLFLATLVGGALMSGGAGAINHYVDRDIDPLMGRTAWRPIPSGVILPR